MRLIATISLIFLSVLAFSQSNPVKVYPNPAGDYINIVIEDVEKGSPVVSIHSIIGNKMQVDIDNITSGVYRAAIKDLPAGYYLVVIKDKRQEINSTIKFLKQ